MRKIKKEELDYSMTFELAMRQFFGNKAEYIANVFHDKKIVKKWFMKALAKMSKDIQQLDTTTRHKEILMASLEWIKADLKENHDPMIIISQLFMLCGRFLGYDYASGFSYLTPFYHQTHMQYYLDKSHGIGKDQLDLYSTESRNVLTKQREIIANLTNEGFNDFQIGMILGQSEYKIKKLKKGL